MSEFAIDLHCFSAMIRGKMSNVSLTVYTVSLIGIMRKGERSTLYSAFSRERMARLL